MLRHPRELVTRKLLCVCKVYKERKKKIYKNTRNAYYYTLYFINIIYSLRYITIFIEFRFIQHSEPIS